MTRWRAIALPIMVVALASCAAPQDAGETLPTAPHDTGETSPTAPTAGARDAPPAVPAFLPSLPDLKPYIRLDADPAALVGKAQSEVAVLLGAPSLLRSDPPAEIWQYAGPACVLHAFFYAEGDGGAHRVAHYEIAARDGAGISRAACFAGFIGLPVPAEQG